MQVQEWKEIEMERDMDLIRDLLLHIASDPIYDGQHGITPDIASEMGITDRPIEEVNYHLNLLIEAGMLKGRQGMSTTVVSRLTWEGHEFIDDIRDQGIWSKTKERIQGLPSVAISVIAEIAKAEIKKKLGL